MRLKLIDSMRRAAVLAGLAAAATGPAPATAQSLAFDTAAPHAIVLDADTGAVLLEKNADVAIPPASMSKLMTAEMAFQALADGRLSLTDRFPVSENAFRKEGSKMFLNLGDEPTVAELLRGIIVQSGNDASIALAEAIAGTEAAFAAAMTERAADIGLRNSSFANATGLPDPSHRMSVRDLATLARHIIDSYPEYYRIYSERSFVWAGVEQRNRNPLLYLGGGGDGLKTGFTSEAGYGIVGSALQNGRRVIAVLAGMESDRARRQEVQRAVAWAFRDFRVETIAAAGAVVGEAEVWLGAETAVPVRVDAALVATLPRGRRGAPTATLSYVGPIKAPVAEGDPIGTLRVVFEDGPTLEAPVVAAASVAEGGYLTRLSAGVGFALRWASGQLNNTSPADAPQDP